MITSIVSVLLYDPLAHWQIKVDDSQRDTLDMGASID